MSSSSQGQIDDRARVWARYDDNWVRHLGLVAQRGDEGVRRQLASAGYSQLDTSLIAPLSILYVGRQRASSIAEALSVSPAYTSKLLARLEGAGYIDRVQDPDDGRVRWLQLTRTGRRLIEAALEMLTEVSLGHQQELGKKLHQEFQAALMDAGEELVVLAGRKIAPPGLQSHLTAVTMSAVSELIQHAIGRMNVLSGHERLTLSHWRLLHSVGVEGNTNSAMAATHELTTQAISRTVRELTQLKYIERRNDGEDGRITRFVYSQRGFELLAATADNIEVLGKSLASSLGSKRFGSFCDSLSALHQAGKETSSEALDKGELVLPVGEQIKRELMQIVDTLSGGSGFDIPASTVFATEELRQLQKIINSALHRKV